MLRLLIRHSAGLATIGLVLMAAGFGPPAPARADELLDFVRSDASMAHASAGEVLSELREQSGDFEGFGAPLQEMELPLSVADTEALLFEQMVGALEASDAAAVRDFWQSTAGQKVLWLQREATTDRGRQAVLRSASRVAERVEPARRDAIRDLDRATLGTALDADRARGLLRVVEAAADQVGAAVGEAAEWAQSPAEIEAWIDGQFHQERFRRQVYTLNRLDDAELESVLAFARSAGGEAFYAARRSAHLAWVDRLVEALLPAQSARLTAELWEHSREVEDALEDDAPEDESF